MASQANAPQKIGKRFLCKNVKSEVYFNFAYQTVGKMKKADFSSIVVINVICKSQKCTYNIYRGFLLYYLLESF